jgi:hypothetical protein
LLLSAATPEIFPAGSMIVKADEARAWQARHAPTPVVSQPAPTPHGGGAPPVPPAGVGGSTISAPVTLPPVDSVPAKPHRFYGSVEIDPARPVRAFEQIVSAVVAELQRSSGVKVKLTLDIEATTTSGFDPSDVGVVRDNAKQLKFTMDATGFE